MHSVVRMGCALACAVAAEALDGGQKAAQAQCRPGYNCGSATRTYPAQRQPQYAPQALPRPTMQYNPAMGNAFPQQSGSRPGALLMAPRPVTPNFNTPVVPFQRGPYAYTPPYPIGSGGTTGFYAPGYAPQFSRQHTGVDIPAPIGAQVRAPVTGRIVRSYPNGANSFIVIQPNGTTTQQVLGHVTCPTCAPGTAIQQGAPFGATVLPYPTGSHVHWGANYNGIPVTPRDGWGWGQAPATSTPAQARNRGWFDPRVGP